MHCVHVPGIDRIVAVRYLHRVISARLDLADSYQSQQSRQGDLSSIRILVIVLDES